MVQCLRLALSMVVNTQFRKINNLLTLTRTKIAPDISLHFLCVNRHFLKQNGPEFWSTGREMAVPQRGDDMRKETFFLFFFLNRKLWLEARCVELKGLSVASVVIAMSLRHNPPECRPLIPGCTCHCSHTTIIHSSHQLVLGRALCSGTRPT